MADFIKLTVIEGENTHILEVLPGTNLRRVLLDYEISPYGPINQYVNCGGRGLCATCGVWIDDGEPAPEHWHDRIGSRFGYPRLSCQVTVNAPMTVYILNNKWIWGRRDSDRAWRG